MNIQTRISKLAIWLVIITKGEVNAQTKKFNFFKGDRLTINIEKDFDMEIKQSELNLVLLESYKKNELLTQNPIIKQEQLCSLANCPKNMTDVTITGRIYETDGGNKTLFDQFYASYQSKSIDKTKDEIHVGQVKVVDKDYLHVNFQPKFNLLNIINFTGKFSAGSCPHVTVAKTIDGKSEPVFICTIKTLVTTTKSVVEDFSLFLVHNHKLDAPKLNPVPNLNVYENDKVCENYIRKVLIDTNEGIKTIILFSPYQPSVQYADIKCRISSNLIAIQLPYRNRNLPANIQPVQTASVEHRKFAGIDKGVVVAMGTYSFKTATNPKSTHLVYTVVRRYSETVRARDRYRDFQGPPIVCFIDLNILFNPKLMKENTCIGKDFKLESGLQGGNFYLCPVSESNFAIYYNAPTGTSRNHDFYFCQLKKQTGQAFINSLSTDCTLIFKLRRQYMYAETNFIVSRITEVVKHKMYAVYWREANPANGLNDPLIHHIVHKISFEWVNATGNMRIPKMQLVDVIFHLKFWRFDFLENNLNLFNLVNFKAEIGDPQKIMGKGLAVYRQEDQYLSYRWEVPTNNKEENINFSFGDSKSFSILLSVSDKFYKIQIDDNMLAKVIPTSYSYYFHVYKYDAGVNSNSLDYILNNDKVPNKNNPKVEMFVKSARIVKFDDQTLALLNKTEYLPVGDYAIAHVPFKSLEVLRCKKYLVHQSLNISNSTTQNSTNGSSSDSFKIGVSCSSIMNITNANGIKYNFSFVKLVETTQSVLGVMRNVNDKPPASSEVVYIVFRYDKHRHYLTHKEFNTGGEVYSHVEIFEENEIISLQMISKNHSITVYQTEKNDYFDIQNMRRVGRIINLNEYRPSDAYTSSVIGQTQEGMTKTTFVAFYQKKNQTNSTDPNSQKSHFVYGKIMLKESKGDSVSKVEMTLFQESTAYNFLRVNVAKKSVCMGSNWFYFSDLSVDQGTQNMLFGINLFDNSYGSVSITDLGVSAIFQLHCIKDFVVIEAENPKPLETKWRTLLFMRYGYEKDFYKRIVGVVEVPRDAENKGTPKNLVFSSSEEAIFVKYDYFVNTQKQTRTIFVNPKGTQLFINFTNVTQSQVSSQIQISNIDLKARNGGQTSSFVGKFKISSQKKEIIKEFTKKKNAISKKQRIKIDAATLKKPNITDIEESFKIQGTFYSASIKEQNTTAATKQQNPVKRILNSFNINNQNLGNTNLTQLGVTQSSANIRIRDRLNRVNGDIKLAPMNSSSEFGFSAMRVARGFIVTLGIFKSSSYIRILHHNSTLIKQLDIPFCCDLLELVTDYKLNGNYTYQDVNDVFALTKCQKERVSHIFLLSLNKSSGKNLVGWVTSTSKDIMKVKGVGINGMVILGAHLKDGSVIFREDPVKVDNVSQIQIQADHQIVKSVNKTWFEWFGLLTKLKIYPNGKSIY